MAFNIQKFPFPKHLANVPCKVFLYGDGLTEDGAPKEAAAIEGKCIFSEHSRRVITEDGKAVYLAGKIILQGDIAPEQSVAHGTVFVGGRKYEIVAGHRPRNPDGSVHHTELELR